MRGGGGKGRKKEEGKGEGGKGAGLPTRLFLMAGAYVLLMFLWLLWGASCAFAAFLCPPSPLRIRAFCLLVCFARYPSVVLCAVLGLCVWLLAFCRLRMRLFGCSGGGVKAAKPPFFTGF